MPITFQYTVLVGCKRGYSRRSLVWLRLVCFFASHSLEAATAEAVEAAAPTTSTTNQSPLLLLVLRGDLLFIRARNGFPFSEATAGALILIFLIFVS